MTYNQLLAKMSACINGPDWEAAHGDGDRLMITLVQLLLISPPTEQDKSDVEKMVEMYRDATKNRWYYS